MRRVIGKMREWREETLADYRKESPGNRCAPGHGSEWRVGGGHCCCSYDRLCACDVEANEFCGDLRAADKGRAFLLEQPVGRRRLEIEGIFGNYRLDDVQDEARPVRHYRRDIDLCGYLEGGETAGRHADLFGFAGPNLLTYITVRRDLLMKHTFGAVARRVEDA